MAAYISGLSRKTQAMTEVLHNVTGEMKQQRKDVLGDVNKLEMKYLEQCALLPLQVKYVTVRYPYKYDDASHRYSLPWAARSSNEWATTT